MDIGPRQQGRLRAPSVLHCGESAAEIQLALAAALAVKHRDNRGAVSRRTADLGHRGKSSIWLASVDINTQANLFIDRHWAADACNLIY